MRKSRLYIFSLWVATVSVLLTTVVTHHHHMGRICMVEEQCAQDGNVNDEHTEHHDEESEGDRENCSVRQMHHFVTSDQAQRSIGKQLLNGSHLLAARLPGDFQLPFDSPSLVIVGWQHVAASTLPDGLAAGFSRRGPPSVFC